MFLQRGVMEPFEFNLRTRPHCAKVLFLFLSHSLTPTSSSGWVRFSQGSSRAIYPFLQWPRVSWTKFRFIFNFKSRQYVWFFLNYVTIMLKNTFQNWSAQFSSNWVYRVQLSWQVKVKRRGMRRKKKESDSWCFSVSMCNVFLFALTGSDKTGWNESM